jgi:hypothetical protein
MTLKLFLFTKPESWVLFYTTNLHNFLANNFFWVHLFSIISTNEIRVKFCIFWILACKKRIKILSH